MKTARPTTPRTDPAEAPDLKATLEPYRAAIEADLLARVPHVPPETFARSLDEYLAHPNAQKRDHFVVYDPIRHVLKAGGKRLRPILTLLAAEAVCGDHARALPTAVGLELLHTFTLVHDDVMDNDLTRRGQPTVHALWGGPIAICVGDGLYALAFQAIAENITRPGVDPLVVVEVARRAAQVSFELCAGQTQDLLFESADDVSLEAYMEMIRLKTGVLLAMSVEAGARMGGGDPATVAALAEYGLQLGLAFQIKDDLLDLVGDEAEIGKPVGSDVRAGKKTYPVIIALGQLDAKGRDRLLAILNAPEGETTAAMVAEAMRMMDKCGALEAADEAARMHADHAKAALAGVARPRSKAALATLAAVADYVVRRRR